MLVTHSLSLLSRADLVLVMEEGRVSEMGSYLQLLERKGAFAKLIHNFSGNQPRESSAYKRGMEGRRNERSRNVALVKRALLYLFIYFVFAVSRKSLSRLSFTDYSIDLSQEQLIR